MARAAGTTTHHHHHRHARMRTLLVCLTTAAVLLVQPAEGNARYCPRSNKGSCERYCQGFSNNLAAMSCLVQRVNGQDTTPSCVETQQGAIVPCVHTSQGQAIVDGCFCCCTHTTGPLDTNAINGAVCSSNDIIGATCDEYCGRFSRPMVSRICQTIGGNRASCARDIMGAQIPCIHTSSSEAGPSGCHCCCADPTQAP